MNKKTIIITSITTAVAVFLLATIFYLSPVGVVFVGKFSDSPVAQRIGKLLKIEKLIENDYMGSYNAETMAEKTVRSYVDFLDDPYSSYYTQNEYRDLTAELDGEYRGIGVSLVGVNGEIVIKSVNPSSPAEKAGLLAEDVILAVNGTKYTSSQLWEAVDIIKNTKMGETVTLTLRRDPEVMDVAIKIEKIKEVLVTSRIMDGNIGYIGISTFGNSVGREFSEHLDELKKKGIKALIIDLRNNPGGTLDSAVKIADVILPEGTIVTVKDKKGNEEIYTSDKKELNLPICVLINESSASASEVVAGALRDHNKAVIVGEKSFGKGVVQAVMDLGDGSGLSLTIAKYFTPSGECIHGVGIYPDIKASLPDDVSLVFGEENSNDTQLFLAHETLKKKIK